MILMLSKKTKHFPRSSSDACQIVANSTLLRKSKPCLKIVLTMPKQLWSAARHGTLEDFIGPHPEDLSEIGRDLVARVQTQASNKPNHSARQNPFEPQAASKASTAHRRCALSEQHDIVLGRETQQCLRVAMWLRRCVATLSLCICVRASLCVTAKEVEHLHWSDIQW